MTALAVKRHAVSTCAFWTVVAVSFASEATLIAVTFTLTTTATATSKNLELYSLALAASVCDVVALTGLLVLLSSYLSGLDRRTLIVFGAAFLLVVIAATVLTLYTLIWIWIQTSQLATRADSPTTRGLVEAGFASCGVAVIAQVVLCVVMLRRPHVRESAQQPRQELEERSSPSYSSGRKSSQTPRPSSTPYGESEIPLSSRFSIESNPKSTLRHSFSRVVRPVTSKSKLLRRLSSTGRYSSYECDLTQPVPANAVMGTDGFETWDTSAVESLDDNVQLSRKHRTTTPTKRLETIPGSRPVSPADPLNGPFPYPPEEPEATSSPIHAPTPLPIADAHSTRNFSRPHSRHSRQPSTTSQSGQMHIHPLFRSESPVPAPLVSPGTIITASPLGGQWVAKDQYSTPDRRQRSHSGKRSTSPALNSHPTMRRLHSAQDMRQSPNDNSPPFEHFSSPRRLRSAQSLHGSGSESPSPESQPMIRRLHSAQSFRSAESVSPSPTCSRPESSRGFQQSQSQLQSGRGRLDARATMLAYD